MRPGRHVVLGATGQVGRHLHEALRRAGVDVVTTGHTRPADHALDLGSPTALRALLDALNPAMIWLVGAYTHVDGCEADPERSLRVNVRGPETAAAWARSHGASLALFSTDYVFDGTAGPYGEDDPLHPLSVYGRHKALAEAFVAEGGGLVLRTAWVYSWEPPPPQNFCQRLVENLRAGQTATIPSDQRGNPTYAPDLAEAAVRAWAAGVTGRLHAAGPAVMSRYAFAQAIAHAFQLPADAVRPVATAALGQAAPRPLNAGLRTERLQAVLGPALRPPDDVLPLLARAHPR